MEEAISKIEEVIPNKSITVNLKMLAKILGVVIPIVVGSGWFQTYNMKGTVVETTNSTVNGNLEERFKLLKAKVDSSQKAFEKKEMAALMLSDGVAARRNMTSEQGAMYVMSILDFADEKIVEDSVWQNKLKPMLLELFAWYTIVKDDCGMVRPYDGHLWFVDCDERRKLREMTYGTPNEKIGKWASDGWYYRDKDDQVVPLRNFKSMVFWAEQ